MMISGASFLKEAKQAETISVDFGISLELYYT